MAETRDFLPGGYRYAPGVFQYSAGVAALPGYELVHARFQTPVALADGFARIAAHLTSIGRPLTAFAACELRSLAPFTEQGFRDFNEIYVGTLSQWGIFKDGTNPVARSNVCPALDPPTTPSFYAFAYTVAASTAPSTAVVAGSGEAPEGHANYRDHIVALDDVSPSGMHRKAMFVTGEMRRRLALLEMPVESLTSAQVYTVEAIDGLIPDVVHPSGLMGHGFTWHYCRPPVQGLAFEMDCRAVRQEIVI